MTAQRLLISELTLFLNHMTHLHDMDSAGSIVPFSFDFSTEDGLLPPPSHPLKKYICILIKLIIKASESNR